MNRIAQLIFAAAVMMLLSMTCAAQNTGTLKGQVRGEDTQSGLAGANVFIPALSRGAVTDMDGNYTIANISNGTYEVEFSFIGYGKVVMNASVRGVSVLNVFLEPTIVEMETVTYEVNRAEIRKTPIAFSNVGKDEIEERYTTQDVPDLLRLVPGVYTTNNGLGEAGIYVRGFDAEHTQIMINGVPVNDPESQVVYWSNWTGLSGNTNSIQVQRGVGSSLYGSGSFGGSINVATGGVDPAEQLSFRLGGGFYDQKLDRGAANYIGAVEYNSGLLADGKLGFNVRYERKFGDSYVKSTRYDGHSFYGAIQSIIGKHKLTFNFIGAPQFHNQAQPAQDMQLFSKLGREYNRYDHPYQENYYFKPQFELHHDWSITDNQFLTTNAFLTFGRGGGRYLRNDDFNVNTGEVGFKAVTDANDAKYFGRHARWIYEHAGVLLNGYDAAAQTYNGAAVTSATNLPTGDFSHSWLNDSHNDHNQFGFNTAYQHTLSDLITYTVGGEIRYWNADHFADSKNFRMSDGNGGVLTVDNVQQRYNYSGIVTNLSGFARILVSPIDHLTLMIDGAYASYNSKVEENAIEIYDFGTRKFTGRSFVASKNKKNTDGTLKFQESDYERTYDFFQPKFGVNYNITSEINALVNYSIAYKEPKVTDWYDRDAGPRTAQELSEERMTNLEFGAAYRTPGINIIANYYIMNFEDKIESITNQDGDRETINAGKARHSGIEVALNGKYHNLIYGVAFTKAENTWQSMNLQEIFGQKKEDVEGKNVPFSPNTIVNGEIGWAFSGIPLKIVLGAQFWDGYYGSYTNTYDHDAEAATPEIEAKLPSFFDLNARIVYDIHFSGTNVELILSGFNLTNNEDNFSEAAYSRDFNRNDAMNGKYYMYVAQAPLRSLFLTAIINI